MKKSFLFFIIVVSLACGMTVTVMPPASPVTLPTNTIIPVTDGSPQISPSPTSILATVVPQATATTLQPSFEGVEVSVDPLSVVVPSVLATGARGIQVPRAEGNRVCVAR
jgi:hypothetical protein